MPIIRTARLLLRDYRETDLNDLHRLLSDKKNMYFLDDIATDSLDQSAENLKAAMANRDGHYFAVCDAITGAYMGGVGYTLTAETPVGKIAHMGYFLLPEYHGMGYATEAVKHALAFAFEEDGCVRITTGCYRDNAASRRVMEKAGFRKEGEHIKCAWHDGKLKDRLDYALNLDDYGEQQSMSTS